jgi:hypothetical protein
LASSAPSSSFDITPKEGVDGDARTEQAETDKAS